MDQNRIYGLGQKGAALTVLFSGVLDDRLHSILLDNPLSNYESVVQSAAYSLDISWFLYGILKHFDLPKLVGSLAPRPCLILNAADAQGETLPESEVLPLYQHSVEMFRQFNAGEHLRFLVYPQHEKSKAYATWLQTI